MLDAAALERMEHAEAGDEPVGVLDELEEDDADVSNYLTYVVVVYVQHPPPFADAQD
jgi:hypothetical protein